MTAMLMLLVGLALLNLYAAALVVLRGRVYHTRVYRPMILNIGLSLAPAGIMAVTVVVMTVVGVTTESGALAQAILACGGVVWLLALPNAAYLITELNLSHRRASDVETVPLWFDIMLVLTLAVSGVFNTLANVALAQLAFAGIFGPDVGNPMRVPGPWIAATVAMVAVAFGIYLGRYLRLNSWDLTHPMGFARKFRDHFASKPNLKTALGFTLTHAIFLGLVYLVVGAPWLAMLFP